MEHKVCQCCFSITYNNNDIKNNLFEQKVIYSELIKDTFDINITSEINKICNQCIRKLKEASEFKRVIQRTQDELLKICKDKQETQNMDTDTTKRDVCAMSTNLWDVDKKSKGPIKDTQYPIHSMIAFQIKSDLTGEKYIKDKCTNIQENVKNNGDKITILPTDVTNRTKIHRATREDSLKLLKYSNICLFKSLKTKFQCYSCKETFFNMSDLRSHTKIHSNTNDRGSKINLKGYSSKNADISSLSCNLCYQACNDLSVLKQHLINKHSIEFASAEHMFVPFKLENGFKCVTCGEDFNSFVRLSTHMNKHSTNNVCEKCGTFFINRLSLRAHLQSVHREKKCTMCLAKFEKNYTKVKHMRIVHNVGAIRRYCTICGKDFKHSYKLLEHKIKEHGAQRLTSNCKECGKTFLSPQNLKIHIRSVHVKERNYQCNVCGMRFFTKADEKRHGRKHEDVKMFSCSYCEGKFKSKDSWRRHLKRIHDKLVVD
ncbi:zinc finger protein 62-like [Vanessa atalanta]|uniref:zinc finger protein 62-like n=1 Tax=Vanessa atalanta TaxID=42275 RepID=UPI001FCD188D|nr:zinc finger protein 62-like [Vanessa atalanta]